MTTKNQELYYKPVEEYVMLLDRVQYACVRDAVDRLIEQDKPNINYFLFLNKTKEFFELHKARLGREIKTYNPYTWHMEIIFDTEQDALLFVLKVL